jgi:hypothetical protein
MGNSLDGYGTPVGRPIAITKIGGVPALAGCSMRFASLGRRIKIQRRGAKEADERRSALRDD